MRFSNREEKPTYTLTQIDFTHTHRKLTFKLNASGQWKDANFPNPGGVFGTASTDVWVAAPGEIWHWNGSAWVRSYSATLSDGGVEPLVGGYARSPTDAG